MTDVAIILKAWGLNAKDYQAEKLGSGLINHTWKVSGPENYILQQVNSTVFKDPGAISDNLNLLSRWIKEHHPGYLFTAPINLPNGDNTFLYDGEVYRLFPFVENSVTINTVQNAKQAYEAARQFGLFTALLNDFDQSKLQYPLPHFHNVRLRYIKFRDTLKTASADRLAEAKSQVEEIELNKSIMTAYHYFVGSSEVHLRVIHHDTKISNVLFDKDDNGLCVIDLDTVMPGFYISDVGDMMRTYLCPVNEEETDLTKIHVNLENFEAIYKGYMSAMGDVLTEGEKNYFIYSGIFLIYMQALRFLTDFLNGDVYYHTTYPGQNLNRAKNQLKLLSVYLEAEPQMRKIIAGS